jgi:hypothetical protein
MNPTDGRMNPTDEVDDLLAKAGAQWRAGQPSAPEPDLDRITAGADRRFRRWVPAVAAASVAVIAAAALVVPGSGEEKAAEPAHILASGNKTDPASLLVRNGDRVEVDGLVIAAPGKPVVFCRPLPRAAVGGLPESPPRCPANHAVELTGVDLDRLSQPSTIQGVRSGSAHLIGIWTDGSIAVQEQNAPRPFHDENMEVPCAPPPGGWPVTTETSLTSKLQAFVDARPDQLGAIWIGWPEGGPGPDSPGADPSLKPSVVMVGVAHGEVAAIRQAVEPLFAGNLCVYRTRFSQTEVKQFAAAVTALPLEQFGVEGPGLGVGDRPVSIGLLVVNEQALAVLGPIGLDKLDLRPSVRPVH